MGCFLLGIVSLFLVFWCVTTADPFPFPPLNTPGFLPFLNVGILLGLIFSTSFRKRFKKHLPQLLVPALILSYLTSRGEGERYLARNNFAETLDAKIVRETPEGIYYRSTKWGFFRSTILAEWKPTTEFVPRQRLDELLSSGVRQIIRRPSIGQHFSHFLWLWPLLVGGLIAGQSLLDGSLPRALIKFYAIVFVRHPIERHLPRRSLFERLMIELRKLWAEVSLPGGGIIKPPAKASKMDYKKAAGSTYSRLEGIPSAWRSILLKFRLEKLLQRVQGETNLLQKLEEYLRQRRKTEQEEDKR